MAQAAGPLLKAERCVFSPLLESYVVDPDRAAAAALYALFGQQLKPFLNKGFCTTSVVLPLRRLMHLCNMLALGMAHDAMLCMQRTHSHIPLLHTTSGQMVDCK